MSQEMDARRNAAREQMAKLHEERQALQERKEGAGKELHRAGGACTLDQCTLWVQCAGGALSLDQCTVWV
eukprot:1157924-Pelagomonas_calceolata.AAC.18